MKSPIDTEKLLDVIRTTPDDAFALRLKSTLMDVVNISTKSGSDFMIRLQNVLLERERYQEQKQRAEEDRTVANEMAMRQAGASPMFVNSNIDYGTRSLR